MPTMIACVSHSPIIMVRAKPPEDEPAILALYERCARAIARFDPELIVAFGTDHFAGFFLSGMPAYCVAFDARAVDDVGGFPGPLKVPADLATGLLQHVRSRGFDPCVSYRMSVDHAYSQPLKRLTGALDRYPTLPVYIGALAPPFLPLERSRRLGEAIGGYIASLGKRVLILGSGGLSHHPTRYYPLIGEGAADVAAWQVEGPRNGLMSEQAWFHKLHEDHLVGADMLVAGTRTREDIRLNPDFDRDFMAKFMAADLDALVAYDTQRMFDQAGIGSLELHTWIAALAAHRAAGGPPAGHSIYSPTLEYGIGYGMAYSDAP